MSLPTDISRRLLDEFGLDESVFRGASLDSVVRQRMEVSGVYEIHDYWDRLRDSRDEYLAFTDLMLVPESWFFRDGKPFAWLVSWLRENRKPKNGQTLRILSVPCASGQEPYSIAMALLAAGFAPQSFRIEAGDLSERFLKQAREGVYRQIAFRGGMHADYSHFFEDAGEGQRRVVDTVRSQVHFQQRNLLAPDFLTAELPYDVIFCRNVLIYFNGDSRQRAVENLLRGLVEGGLIFAGHADALGSITPEMRPIGPAGAFCFHRVVPSAKLEKTAAPAPKSMPPRPVVARHKPRSPAPQKEPAKAPIVHWDNVRELADSGKLDQAEKACRELMDTASPTAEGFCALGEILTGQRRHREAETCFRRAVYLDARHGTALLYLALMAERRGDNAGAERFRRRAKAAQTGSGVEA
ncbi:MAG: CheR family methyltransferase [Puniceicoccales bacterium]